MIELETTAMAHRGEAVGRVDGKAHFVAGALPGERIAGEVIQDGGSWARVELRSVLEPSDARTEPICAHYAACGGCQWQHADIDAQLEWKRETVAGQLAHVGKLRDVDVRPTVSPGPEYGYRNRMDFNVLDGAPALHRGRSRELVALQECHLLSPALREMFDALGDLGEAREITLRASEALDERLAVVVGAVPDGIDHWGSRVAQRTRHGLRALVGPSVLHEDVAGHRFRITGTSFFQNNTAGAATLVELVRQALEPGPGDVLVDAFAGGGLFAVTVGGRAGSCYAIEISPTAISDLRHNASVAETTCTVLPGSLEDRLRDVAEPVDMLIVDPPRAGLKAKGVAAVLEALPTSIAYVSCDPASFSRDAALLVKGGYALDWVTPVDLFPQTWHIESVARFSL